MLVFPQIYRSSQGESDYIFGFDNNGLFQYPETVVIPNTVTALIGSNMRSFYNHSEIKHIIFEEGSVIDAIPVSAFDYCTNLEDIAGMSENISSIGNYAFRNCHTLTGFVFGDVLSLYIGNQAFLGCSALNGIIFLNSTTSLNLSGGAFQNCTSLTEEDVERILSHPITTAGTMIFTGCNQLKVLNIRTTGPTMFNNCTGLENVMITGVLNSAGSLGRGAFAGCSNLKTLTITSADVRSIDEIYCQNCTSLESVSIPAGVTMIGNYAFQNCTSLETITLPAGVTSIAANAFTGCTKLTDIKLGAGWNCASSFSVVTTLTADSMEAMLESLADLTGSTKKTFTLGSSNLAKLTDEQKAIATDKNWNLA